MPLYVKKKTEKQVNLNHKLYLEAYFLLAPCFSSVATVTYVSHAGNILNSHVWLLLVMNELNLLESAWLIAQITVNGL